MKVLIWTNTFPRYSETFIRDQIIGLKKKGVDVYIYNTQEKNLDEANALKGFEDFRLLDDIVYKASFTPKIKWFRKIKAIYILLISLFNGNFSILKSSLDRDKFNNDAKNFHLFYFSHFILANQIDVVHAHFGTNGLLATKLKKINLPIKLVTTFHGFDIRLGLQKPNDFYKDLFDYADNLIAISNYNKDKLISFGANPEKIKIIPNGINLEFFKKRKSKKNRNIKFLTVARLVVEKDLQTAITAFSKLLKIEPALDATYTIIGAGPLKDNLEAQINELNLKDKIFIEGAKTSKEVRDAMVNSDIFVLSSIAEVLPTVLLEAQACEMNIVATNVGSVKDILINGILVPMGNANSLLEGLVEVINAKNDWVTIGGSNREYIKDNYDSNDVINQLIHLYNE